jgi:hypothetical protein
MVGDRWVGWRPDMFMGHPAAAGRVLTFFQRQSTSTVGN